MEQKNSRLRKPAIWFVLTGIVASILFLGYFKPNIIIQYLTEKPGIPLQPFTVPAAWAAAPQVKGSPNVAVTSWSSSSTTFVLWSNGRITDASTGTPVATSWSSSGLPTPAATAGYITGSPNVAIGILPTSSATYILFADGGSRNPGPPANAPSASSGPWTRASGNIYPTTLTDNVGIGTTTPGVKLDINGKIEATALGRSNCAWSIWFRIENGNSPQYAPDGAYIAGIDYQAETGGADGVIRFYYCYPGN